jgi:hypothetical protein
VVAARWGGGSGEAGSSGGQRMVVKSVGKGTRLGLAANGALHCHGDSSLRSKGGRQTATLDVSCRPSSSN